MRSRYWAKNNYRVLDPVLYEEKRFSGKAGKMIGNIEKQTIFELLSKHIKNSKNRLLGILDVATGPGRLAFYLEDRIKGVKITAMDINKNMLKRAKELAKINKSKIKFVQGDLYYLPFKDKTFDVVVGLRFSMHLPDFSIVLSELSRVLKPGGILVFDFFNQRSLLALKTVKSPRNETGLFLIEEIREMAFKNKLLFESSRGILFVGETLLRRVSILPLWFFRLIMKPPSFAEQFSTKIVIVLKKGC